MNILKKMCALFLFTLIYGCSSGHDTALTPYEEALKLDSSNTRNFHSMLYFPSGTALHFPGYIVAIEKAPQELVGGPKVSPSDNSLISSTSYFDLEKPSLFDTKHQINRFQEHDLKAMFISHIIKNDFMEISGYGNKNYITNNHCFVYNAYLSRYLSSVSKADLTKINDWNPCPPLENGLIQDTSSPTFYKSGNDALSSLKEYLNEDVKSGAYSHILLIVMGWNTSQSEAIRNFNDITGNIMAASQEQGITNGESAREPKTKNNGLFRPLVIGVTWPSYWSNSVGNVFSYGNKANDADEIGLTWLNKLINETLKQSTNNGQKLPVVVVGHSFGARAVTRALFSSPALEKGKQMVSSPVRLAVALQGAMSINRFSPANSDEGAPYRDYPELKNTHIVLTASRYDKATGPVFWYEPAGAINSYKKACEDTSYKGIFHCMVASDNSEKQGGKFSLCNQGDDTHNCANPLDPSLPVTKVEYIDTSKGITQFNSPGTNGVAHSDIYRLPMGRLLWRLIQQYTLNNVEP